MKATTTLRRAVCIGAIVLALSAAGGCRGGQFIDDGVRNGSKYGDDVIRDGTNVGQKRGWRGPSFDHVKTGTEVLCKANEQRTGIDSPYC
jgi:hypothetical protein